MTVLALKTKNLWKFQGYNSKNLWFFSNYTIYNFLGTANNGAVHIPYQKNHNTQKTAIFSHFPKNWDIQVQFLINLVLENIILISNMAMKYGIFYEFIKK